MSREQLTSNRKAWTIVITSLGVFMTALDTLVVTTALPVLRVDLHASLPQLEWTVNAYNLAFACLLLTGATASDAGACSPSACCSSRPRRRHPRCPPRPRRSSPHAPSRAPVPRS
jgi:MFS family permease